MQITELKGIGEKTAKLFYKLGVETVEELLELYPRAYDTYSTPVCVSETETGKKSTIIAEVAKIVEVRRIKRLTVVSTFLKDDNGDFIKAVWFNQPYLKNQLKVGNRYAFRGMVTASGASRQLEHPEIMEVTDYSSVSGAMQPIYPLTKGLTNKLVCKTMKQALKSIIDSNQTDSQVIDYLPEKIKTKYHLMTYMEAVKTIHFPANMKEMTEARKRLVFDEFFMFISAIRKFKEEDCFVENSFDIVRKQEVNDIISKLPYKLTGAQERALKEIRDDITGNRVMNRLIQGDVGSGKTILAELALIEVALNGYQGAIMVPTEVLAKQHYKDLVQGIEDNNLNLKVNLLTGSLTAKQKREVYRQLENHEIDIIIGTHALFQEKVNYHNLALVVTDEQHRFGVRQREALGNKGAMPHIMVMSATPIPRTLAIILYGDLSVSLIDELPANRLPIKNCVVNENYRPNAYKFMQKEIDAGHQVYVICSMVEESEGMDCENVIDYADKLEKVFCGRAKITYLHGKMKPAEKNEIMEKFANHEIDILVSTTVVEVGVNVPNATVMMIENAERFGLAALHQLRGRVGRGASQSYCIFINASDKKESSKRLEILNKSNDGFYIANEDLKLRGPGDFFGVRQSGVMEFKLADVFTDANVLKMASDAVEEIDKGNIYIMENEKQVLEKRISQYVDKYMVNINL